MRDALHVAGVLAALSICTTAAQAAGAAPTLQNSATNAQGMTTIVSTLGTDPANPYDSSSGDGIAGASSALGFIQHHAVPFTPDHNYSVKAINLALGHISGVNGVSVSLNADNAGAPGAVLKKGRITGLPRFGTCCTIVSLAISGTPVTAGVQYWVVVKTDKTTADTYDAWDYNNIGAVGPYALYNGEGGWVVVSGQLTAFSVVGKRQ